MGKLITIPKAHLDKILPNKGIPIAEILNGLNKDSAKELIRYGGEIKSDILRILEKMKATDFSDEDKKLILDIVDEYCNPELYLKRFNIILTSIKKRLFSYGQTIDLTKYRIDIPRSLCEAHARNSTRRIRSKIENELNVLDLSEGNSNNQEVNQMPDPKKVFVVHGRDSCLRDDFFSFLRALGLQPIEWSEALKFTGKATPYIGEALESAFGTAQAVIVLLSPDDEVRLSPELWEKDEDEKEKSVTLQARPNVLFEAGMAFGKNPDRTLLVAVGQVKAFSDVAGRHIVRLSNSPEKRNDIAERLRTVGCDVTTTGNDWLKTGHFVVTREIKNESIGYSPEDLTEADILALLYNWWPRSVGIAFSDNVTVNFREIDQLLSLPSGSTKKYISQIALRKNFKSVSSGNVVATFEYDVSSDHFGNYFELRRD